MSHDNRTFSLPGPIAEKIRLVQRRMTGVGLVTAAVAAAAVLVAAMSLAMLVDYLATLYDSAWRGALTYSALIAALATLAGWAVLAWRRASRLENVAREVDRRLPYLEERWSTIAHFAEAAKKDPRSPSVVHPAMYGRVAGEAAAAEKHVAAKEVVSLGGVVKAFLALNAVTVVLVLAAVADVRQTSVLLRRFWAPSANISVTQIDAQPGDTVIGRGEPLLVTASFTGSPVDEATLFLRGEETSSANQNDVAAHFDKILLTAKVDSRDSQQKASRVSHRFRTVEQSFAYRVRGGDGQTPWRLVTVADRPVIAAVQVEVTPPEYRKEKATRLDKLPRRLSAVAGSQLAIAIKPKDELKSLALQMEDGAELPLSADADGWYRWRTELKENLKLTPILTEPQGLKLRRPPTTAIHVYPDRPPVVRVVSPSSEIAVTPNETIEIEFVAEDDNGIAAAELVVMQDGVGPGEPPIELTTIPIDLGEAVGEKQVHGSTKLDLSQYPLVDGAGLSYAVRVVEQRSPNLPRPQTAPPQNTPPGVDREVDPPQLAHNPQTPSDQPTSQSSSNVSPTSRADQQASADMTPQPTNKEPVTGSPVNGSPVNRSPINEDPINEDEQEGALAKAADTPTSRNTVAGGESQRSDRSEPSAAPAKSIAKAGGEAAAKAGENSRVEASGARQPSSQAKSLPATSAQVASVPESSEPGSGKLAEAPAEGSAEEATGDTDLEIPDENIAGGETPSAVKPRGAGGLTDAARGATAEEETNRKAESQPQTIVAARPPAPNSESTDQEKPGKNSTAGAQAPQSSQTAQSNAQPMPRPATGDDQRSPSDPSGDNMTRRQLDIGAQASASNRMRVKVDKYAGSFAGQQRAKLEIALAPQIAEIEEQVRRAEKLARSVLDDLGAGKGWQARHHRDVSAADRSVKQAQEVVRKLGGRTHNTPYAFLGLQISDISAANLTPARDCLWKSLQAKDQERAGRIRQGWQQLGQALDRLASLTQRFEQVKREFALADATKRIEKMYRVFVEDSFARPLGEGGDRGSPFNRKMVEFDLDEEYLARLQEVLEMQRELRAELAKILAQDPRLLRRFMNNFRQGADNLRNQLTELRELQDDLTEETKAWSATVNASADVEKDQQLALTILTRRRLAEPQELAREVGEMADRFEAWMPLDEGAERSELLQGELKAGLDEANALAADAREFAVQAAKAARDSTKTASYDALIERSEALYDRLRGFEVVLRRLGSSDADGAGAEFVVNRLAETRRLITKTSSWNKRMKQLSAGRFHGAAAIEQYELATQTDELAGKLADLEPQLAGLLQTPDGTLPPSLANGARVLLKTLDEEATPNQLASAIAIERQLWTRVAQRQEAASAALAKAEEQFDQLIKRAIGELDQLPVQDPIAQLQDEPTLDEILALLTSETQLPDALGIPRRRSNLRIISDWLRPGDGNGGGGGQMAMQQMRGAQQRMTRAARLAQRQALERIKRDARVVRSRRPEDERPQVKVTDWNVLVSTLDDDLLQGRDKLPPEQYRAAIEQYRTIMNRVASKGNTGQ